MNLKYPYHLFLLFTTSLLINSCVEPYDFKTEDFDSALVIQATITDELKQHEIFLTRTYRLEEEAPTTESGAHVSVVDEAGREFLFPETEPGRYRSSSAFAPQAGLDYHLRIETSNGRSYTSDPAILIQGGTIDDLVAQRGMVEGIDGVALLVNSNSPETASSFYKYEYEETYKIVSPSKVSNNLIPTPQGYEIVPNTRNETVCYQTLSSKNIILSNTSTLSENSTNSMLVRFLESDNPVLARRYSILIKQFSLSPEAFSYYATLEKISGSESLFSENQPGFVYGNIYSLEDEAERVIGFFHLSSIANKRIFFNYEDFFELDGNRPQFPENCSIFRPGIDTSTPVEMIRSGDARFVGFSSGLSEGEIGDGPFRLISTECVDCTVYGTPEVPEFWEE